jgi:hypothetical protein
MLPDRWGSDDDRRITLGTMINQDLLRGQEKLFFDDWRMMTAIARRRTRVILAVLRRAARVASPGRSAGTRKSRALAGRSRSRCSLVAYRPADPILLWARQVQPLMMSS